MTNAAPAREDAPTRTPHWGVADAAAGVVLALLLMYGVERLIRTVAIDEHLQLLMLYLAVWLPLLGTVVWATTTRGARSLVADFGLRFTWLDLLWGIGAGLVLRAVATLVEIAFYGQPAAYVSLGDTVYDGWWLFGAVLAPVLVGPFVEELFFRGLMQRSLGRAGSSLGWSVSLTAVVFALLHVVDASSPTSALVIGISTLLFGIGVGFLAGLTGRIGGAIIAHVTFNAALIATILAS